MRKQDGRACGLIRIKYGDKVYLLRLNRQGLHVRQKHHRNGVVLPFQKLLATATGALVFSDPEPVE